MINIKKFFSIEITEYKALNNVPKKSLIIYFLGIKFSICVGKIDPYKQLFAKNSTNKIYLTPEGGGEKIELELPIKNSLQNMVIL